MIILNVEERLYLSSIRPVIEIMLEPIIIAFTRSFDKELLRKKIAEQNNIERIIPPEVGILSSLLVRLCPPAIKPILRATGG
jgi:hypothetical protein